MPYNAYKQPQRRTIYGKAPARHLRPKAQIHSTKTRLRKPLRRQRKPARNASNAVSGAKNRLRNFRQASILAVAITGFIMLLFSPGEESLAQTDSVAETEEVLMEVPAGSLQTAPADTITEGSSKEAATEALGALEGLWKSFAYNLPKMLIAAATLLLAWGLVFLLKKLLPKILGRWNSSSAIISLISIAVWLLAIGIAISVVAGDIRALVGSLGLIGLALSWSLQTPIECFTGWLMNSFKAYYRVGDRIRVGEVFGDVYSIDFLTTTVWEIGSPFQAGYVNAEQPTGRMVTFPNNEILTGTVINLTGDFPYVWDELAIAVANESDLKIAKEVLGKTAQELLGNYMETPARRYAILMKKARLEDNVADQPQVFLSLEDSWTNLTIRYLVGARERRKWKTELIFLINQEINKPEYLNKIIPVYPRQQVQFIDPDGVPVSVGKVGNTDGQIG